MKNMVFGTKLNIDKPESNLKKCKCAELRNLYTFIIFFILKHIYKR